MSEEPSGCVPLTNPGLMSGMSIRLGRLDNLAERAGHRGDRDFSVFQNIAERHRAGQRTAVEQADFLRPHAHTGKRDAHLVAAALGCEAVQ